MSTPSSLADGEHKGPANTNEGNVVQAAESPWTPSSKDANLSGAVSPGGPGRNHTGGDLDLHMGWDRFEKLMLLLSRSTLGIRDVQMRRYGTLGQTQHGIDLAGREPDNRYTVIQCKEYISFSASDLRAAVEKFASGVRPYDAHRFIVATSDSTQSTELLNELLALQDEHLTEFEIELWGLEEINDLLRSQGGIVARFWSRETADSFCTGAPLAGVPAPPPDRQQQAEQILLGPLKTDEMVKILRSAEAKAKDAPADAAALYGDLASRLDGSGFRGHSSAMRARQLDALRAAHLIDEAADLAASQAVLAIWAGDRNEARKLSTVLENLAVEAENDNSPRATDTLLQASLIDAAVDASLRVTGGPVDLFSALESVGVDQLPYYPRLVLILAEDLFATAPKSLATVKDQVENAITAADVPNLIGPDLDLLIRLRLIKAEYDRAERLQLAKEARRHQFSARQASIVSAREARRCCIEGRIEDAQEYWRDAIEDAIHAGLTQDAAQWLYAIRALNVRYGPLTVNLDEEHRLAQALRASGGDRLINLTRDPREEALSALVLSKPIEAVISAKRWLTDSIICGAWASETEALEFVGDLYRDNRETEEAATLYLRAGASKKLQELALSVRDSRLPIGDFEVEPWWVQSAQAMIISAQEDLLNNDESVVYIDWLLELTRRGRSGELQDSPTHSLFFQATDTLCGLVHRGTVDQAQRTLHALGPDVQREAGHYRLTDGAHANMCVRLAENHPSVAVQALSRLFALAEQGTHQALELLADGRVIALLGGDDKESHSNSTALAEEDIASFRERGLGLVKKQWRTAEIALASLEPKETLLIKAAERARDRILTRKDPNPNHASFGTMLPSDAYLVATCLSVDDQFSCLELLMKVAADSHETAANRQQALAGARNLVIDQPTEHKKDVFNQSKAFVLGDRDGSHLDEWTGEPHPLSSFKISFGSGSLRGSGIRLAVACAESFDDRSWVRDQAMNLLASEDRSDVQAAAAALSQLPAQIVHDVEANLLVSHSHVNVRQLCSLLCIRQPERFRVAALRLSKDSDHRVRATLAEAARTSAHSGSQTVQEILATLVDDARHSVRVAATTPA